MTCSTRAHGRVAHECIIDTRPFADSAGRHRRRHRQAADGLRVPRADHELAGGRHADDRADRVETKAELDRFCDAMLAIREEIRAIEEGRIDRENNPLKNAPHTMEDLVRDWDRPYSREEGCFPPGAFRVDKYWPPVNRVDNAMATGTWSAPARRRIANGCRTFRNLGRVAVDPDDRRGGRFQCHRADLAHGGVLRRVSRAGSHAGAFGKAQHLHRRGRDLADTKSGHQRCERHFTHGRMAVAKTDLGRITLAPQKT
jgi:hypothetical protein